MSQDDQLELSSAALEALKAFVAQRTQDEELLLNSDDAIRERIVDQQGRIQNIINEDWQLSQFWYDDDTSTKLGREIIRASEGSAKIACLCSPTLFAKILFLEPLLDVYLFEYDERFNIYGTRFIHYDYNYPSLLVSSDKTKVPLNSFDVVYFDPPFLSKECFINIHETVKMISKPSAKWLACTGYVMENIMKSEFNMRRTMLRPTHERRLSNEFSCFANFDTSFGWDCEEIF